MRSLIAQYTPARWFAPVIRTATILTAFSVLALVAAASSPLHAARQAAMVIDANSGKTLHADQPDRLVYPASLTKMMTLFIVFDELKAGHLKNNTRIVFSRRAANVQPSKLGLKRGQTISIRTAIKALITKSANDVAIALAEHISGSERAFGRRMTKRARQLGMSKTVFTNASGLPDKAQVTTPRDMITLALGLMDRHAKYYHLFSLRSFTFKGRRYGNHNSLLKNFRGTDGLKTGYTRASGYNLVASTRRDGKHVIGAVFGGKTGARRDAKMRSLLTQAFKRASRRNTRRRNTGRPSTGRQQRAQPPRLVRAVPRPRRVLKERPRLVAARPTNIIPAVAPQPAWQEKPTQSFNQRLMAPAQSPQPKPDWTAFVPAQNVDIVRPPPVRMARAPVLAPPQQRSQQFSSVVAPQSGVARQNTLPDVPPPLPRDSSRQPPMSSNHASRLEARFPAAFVSARQPSTFEQQASNLRGNSIAPRVAAHDMRSTLLPRPRQHRAAVKLPASASWQVTRHAKKIPRSTVMQPVATKPKTGRYHVQIGAFYSRAEARRRIAVVRASAGSLLAGYQTLTMTYQTPTKRFYRARFKGFQRQTANTTCSQLRNNGIDCFVVRAY